jgi:hypothetical protein
MQGLFLTKAEIGLITTINYFKIFTKSELLLLKKEKVIVSRYSHCHELNTLYHSFILSKPHIVVSDNFIFIAFSVLIGRQLRKFFSYTNKKNCFYKLIIFSSFSCWWNFFIIEFQSLNIIFFWTVIVIIRWGNISTVKIYLIFQITSFYSSDNSCELYEILILWS